MGRGPPRRLGSGPNPGFRQFFYSVPFPHSPTRSTKPLLCSTSYHVHFLGTTTTPGHRDPTPRFRHCIFQILKPPLPKTFYAIQRTLNVQLLYTTRNPKANSNLKNNDNILPPITPNKRTYLPILLFWVILPKANNTGPFPLLPHRRHLIIYPIRRHPPLRT